MKIPAIAIHGGSGTISFDAKDPESEKQYLNYGARRSERLFIKKHLPAEMNLLQQ